MSEPKVAALPAVEPPETGMFGDEGQRVLDDQGAHLFPVTVRPAFLCLLWIALAALAAVAAVVLVALAGRMP